MKIFLFFLMLLFVGCGSDSTQNKDSNISKKNPPITDKKEQQTPDKEVKPKEPYSKEIAKIPEASGICYSSLSETLFIANDEGSIYEIDKNGSILRAKKIGDYNLEGVSCDDEKDELLFTIEGKDNILIVSQSELSTQKEINIDRDFDGIRVLKKDKKHGLEGIAITEEFIYLSNQSYESYPEEDASVVIKVSKNDDEKLDILSIIDHGYLDISGLFYERGYLYMVSDSSDLLIKYDLKNEKTIFEKELPIFAQEGICIDDEGYFYIANDNGSVFKYNKEALGL